MTEETLLELKAQAESEGWETIPYLQNGRMTALGIIKGTEFHCQLADTCKFNRRHMGEILQPLLDREGYLTTRVRVDDKENRRFNRLFGFEKTWSDGTFDYFILTNIRFRRNACL